MSDSYQANEYCRQAQRYIYPLYKKDQLGGYNFSSTATFATHKNEYFCIFAAHALEANENTLEGIGFLVTDGSFVPLSDSCKSHKIHREHDIVICSADTPFEPRYHFDLEPKPSNTIFNTHALGWIGFPQKKAIQTIHPSKAAPEKIASHLTIADDGRPKWNHAKFLLIGAKIESKSNKQITGKFENKGVNYKYEGFKQQGYSPRGMSGGAFFHAPEKLCPEPKRLEDMFRFAGIGLEYDGTTIKGVPRELILFLVEQSVDAEKAEPQAGSVTPG